MGKEVFDVNPEGEERHHPYFDAPEERLASAGKLHVNEPPPDVKPMDNFRRNHPDFDSPPEKMLEAGNVKGKGVAAAVGGDIDSPVFEPAFFDAPLEKIAEAGNIHVNEQPPDVQPMDNFRRRHPDFDAPVEKMIEAGNVQPSEFAMKKTVTGSGEDSKLGPYDINDVEDD